MISVKNLTKIYKTPVRSGNVLQDIFKRKYQHTTALNNISFQIGENELVGFIGPNGAGKTTTMKILAGILYPNEGEVSVLGFTPFKKKHDYLKKIGFIMGQKNQLLWELPPTDAFMLNKIIYKLTDTEYKKNLNELVELLNAAEFIHRPVKTLSLGQRMRAELIAALLHRPQILFLDEPTIGLDIFAQSTVVEFIKQYQQKYKATIMLTSHYMQDVQRLAQRVIMIDKGKIVHDGDITNLLKNFAQEKVITIILHKKIQDLGKKLSAYKYTYDFPRLRIQTTQEKLNLLLKVLEDFEYSDMTIESEELEEVVKKIFNKST